jgi:hypothetical protein
MAARRDEPTPEATSSAPDDALGAGATKVARPEDRGAWHRAKSFFGAANGAVGFAAALIGILVTLGLIRASGGERSPEEASAAAATALGNADTVTWGIVISAHLGNEAPSIVRGKGSADLVNSVTTSVVDYSHMRPRSSVRSIRFIGDGPDGYIRPDPPPSKRRPWLHIDFARAARQDPLKAQRPVWARSASAEPNDLSHTLKNSVKAVKDLRKVGDERSFGVPVTHYRGTLGGPDKQVLKTAGLNRAMWERYFGPFMLDLWIDDSGLPRRYLVSSHKDSNASEVDVTFARYGMPVVVHPPPQSRVRPLRNYSILGCVAHCPPLR